MNLKVKLFADGADLQTMLALASKPEIQGLTTNPTLMKKAGVTNYEKFAREVLEAIPSKSISFEVFSDDFEEMRKQALTISSWGNNVYVKVPVTNTKGDSSGELIRSLSGEGVKLNVTALTTVSQVEQVVESLVSDVPSYISVFAGRIADTGVDPLPIMIESLNAMRELVSSELIWASPRELLNVIQANDLGVHIITATPEILSKLNLLGKDLISYSRETVQMFFNDAMTAGFEIS